MSILGVLALVGIGTRQPSVEAPLRASEYAPALVRASIDAPPEVLAEVLVETPTLRADTRAHLRETLSTYVSEHQGVRNSDDVTPQSEVTTPASLPRGEHPEQSVKWCDTPEGAAVPSIEPWGPVLVFEGEGARVVRTVREQADGTAYQRVELPVDPVVHDTETCLPRGMIGILLDGTVVTPETKITPTADGLLGYALDGFPIYAPYEDGREIVQSDLDRCHGHVHEIVDQGVVRSLYHYHITEEYPYSIACFRGTPVSLP